MTVNDERFHVFGTSAVCAGVKRVRRGADLLGASDVHRTVGTFVPVLLSFAPGEFAFATTPAKFLA